MKHLIVGFVGGWLSLGVAAADPPMNVAFEDLPKLLKAGSPLLKSAEQSVEASRIRARYPGDLWVPRVFGLAGGTAYQTGPLSPAVEPYGGVEAAMSLYRGGKEELEHRSRAVAVMLADTDREQLWRTELAEVQALFWRLVAQRELVQLSGALLKRNEDVEKAAARRAAKGLATQTEVTALAFHGSQLQEQVESARHESELIQRELTTHLGLSPETIIHTVEQVPHAHDVADKNPPVPNASQAPGVRQWEAQKQWAEIHREQWSKWSAPSLEAYGSYLLYTFPDRSYANLLDRSEWAAGVRLRVPLWEGSQAAVESEGAQALARAHEERIRHERRRFEAGVHLAREEALHLDHLVESSKSLSQHMEGIFGDVMKARASLRIIL